MIKDTVTLTESQLCRIISDSVRCVLNEQYSHYETWYRGYNSRHPNFGSPNGLWLVDNIDYAYGYASQFGDDGRITEFKLDLGMDDLVSVDSFPGEFDGYMSSELYDKDGELDKYIQRLHQQGVKGYSIPQDDGECIFLWDLSPIVSTRDLTRKEIEEII